MLTDDLTTPRLVLRSTREEWGELCLELWLDEENAASNGVMRKLGFQIVGEDSFRKRGTDIVYPEYIYRLELGRQEGCE